MKLNKITKLILLLIIIFIAEFYVTQLIEEANHQNSTKAATKSGEVHDSIQTTLKDADGDGYYTFSLIEDVWANIMIRNDAQVRMDYSMYDDETGELIESGKVESGHTFQTDDAVALPSGQYHITIVSDDGSAINTYVEISY